MQRRQGMNGIHRTTRMAIAVAVTAGLAATTALAEAPIRPADLASPTAAPPQRPARPEPPKVPQHAPPAIPAAEASLATSAASSGGFGSVSPFDASKSAIVSA